MLAKHRPRVLYEVEKDGFSHIRPAALGKQINN